MFPFYRPAGCKLWVELLEDRNAPAATAVLTEGVLDVRGGDGPDTISLRAQGGLLTVPEAGASFPADAVRLVSVLAGPGDDVVSVAPEVAAPVWLFGGPGDDTLTGGGGADQFYGGDGDDVLDGGPGDDTLFGGRGADVLSDLRGTNAVSQGLPSRTVENTAAEARLIEQTNAARQAAGLAPLRVSAALNAAAAFHAGRMAALAPALGAGAVFEHDLPGSPAPVLTARIDYAGYDSAYVAENLVMGAGLGDAVVGLWMGSPVHRANIVNPALTEVGLAAREGPDGAVFYVQVFGTPRPPEGGLPAGLIAAGPGPGAVPVVALFDGRGNPAGSLPAFGEGARGGVRVAAADVTGDGVPDVIAAPGPGVPSEVAVLDGATGEAAARFLAFEPGYAGGAYVAAADFNGDGFADIVVTPDEGGGARVRVFDGRGGATLADFLGIEDANFRGGARVAAGDVNGDGVPDLLVGAGFGGGPRLAVFDGRGLRPGPAPPKLFPDFFVFEPALRNGVYLAAGDLDGDGADDLVIGGGPGGGPRVFALSGRALAESGGGARVQLANFFAGDPSRRGGVRVAAKDLDGDGRAEVIAGGGEPAPVVNVYAGADIPPDGAPATDAQFRAFADAVGGIFVG